MAENNEFVTRFIPKTFKIVRKIGENGTFPKISGKKGPPVR